jgi:hypothetical protein
MSKTRGRERYTYRLLPFLSSRDADADVDAIVVRGAGTTFVADIKAVPRERGAVA